MRWGMMAMNDFVIEESNLRFDFSHCGKPIKFDNEGNHGLFAVDFLINKDDYTLFIEVKDYQNPNASTEQRNDDLHMLLDAGIKDKSVFTIKMGEKIKNSLLMLYAEGKTFTKNVLYLLFINFDDLKADERRHLSEKILGFIPTGLNNLKRFPAFKRIDFKLVDAKRLKQYGINCTNITAI
jgi:hypothetical protein